MDLEEIVRRLHNFDRTEDEIIQILSKHGIQEHFSRALLLEIENSEQLPGLSDELRKLISPISSGLQAGFSGLGSRGDGDFIIHRAIATVAATTTGTALNETGSVKGSTDLIIGPDSQDDGGVVRLPDNANCRQEHSHYLVTSVDGLHSRLSHFPFLAGFHVARACLRDVLVMGARPVALFSDVHLANNGDPAVILDYTAGISVVGEAIGVPLVAGSTLRIGGDLVTGDRLSGAAGAVGVTSHITPRKALQPGDVLVMSRGSGGGTITATALFHGSPAILEETLNIDFLRFTKRLVEDPVIHEVHTMTDVTNGGIRGDLREMAHTAGVDIILDPLAFRGLLQPRVLEMLESYKIDPMGVSIDALLVACPTLVSDRIVELMKEDGIDGAVIGYVEACPGNTRDHEDNGPDDMNSEIMGRVFTEDPCTGMREEMMGKFRESPYTPVKEVADAEKMDPKVVRERMELAVRESERKKQWVRERLSRGR